MNDSEILKGITSARCLTQLRIKNKMSKQVGNSLLMKLKLHILLNNYMFPYKMVF